MIRHWEDVLTNLGVNTAEGSPAVKDVYPVEMKKENMLGYLNLNINISCN